MGHHSLIHWVVFMFIGGVVGLMAGRIAWERGFGISGDIIIGILGALLAVWVAGEIARSLLGVVILAFIGSAILVSLIRLIKRSV
jgi:uncharacterized membrane protein YeaQ/YmgE (transglycosylase-associated protein family)